MATCFRSVNPRGLIQIISEPASSDPVWTATRAALRGIPLTGRYYWRGYYGRCVIPTFETVEEAQAGLLDPANEYHA